MKQPEIITHGNVDVENSDEYVKGVLCGKILDRILSLAKSKTEK